MSLKLRLLLSVTALLGVFVIGASGYVWIEGDQNLSALDAAYMTTITLSTVGFGEVWDLSPAGKLWTIGVITFGIATVSIAFTSLIALMVGGELRSLREERKMTSTIDHLKDHIILCGFGRMGSLALDELKRKGLTVVVVERDARLESAIRETETLFVIGDATDEATLERAGFSQASAIVVGLPSDADNTLITLTARSLRPDIPIIARAEQPATESKLKRAGATKVVCPQAIGAMKVVNILTRPHVVDFVEVANLGVGLEMDEYALDERSLLAGKRLCEVSLRDQGKVTVVAIKHADGATVYNPAANDTLLAGDTLIVVGPPGVSDRLDRISAGGRST